MAESNGNHVVALDLKDERSNLDDSSSPGCDFIFTLPFIQKLIAEMFGTYFLIFAGCGAVVVNAEKGNITFPGISIVWGLVVMVMVYSVGHISGAHFNPAVTIAFASCRRFPFKQIGELAGLAVGATVLLNVMFAGPISGASMNPARSLGPAIVSKKYTGIWIYLLGPTAGAIAGAWVYNTIRFTDKPLREITKSGSFLRSKGSGSRNGSK
nr:aquaporin NIP1-1-like [Ipomoea batatas]